MVYVNVMLASIRLAIQEYDRKCVINTVLTAVTDASSTKDISSRIAAANTMIKNISGMKTIT